MDRNLPRRQNAARGSVAKRLPSAYYRRTRQPEKRMDRKEKFVLQCIICGMILAGVLLVKIVDISSANRLEQTLSTALSENLTADGLRGALTGAAAKVSSLSSLAQSALTRAPETAADPTAQTATEPPVAAATEPPRNTDSAAQADPMTTETAPTAEEPTAPTAEEPTTLSDDGSARIDEEILYEINTREDLYNAPKKP